MPLQTTDSPGLNPTAPDDPLSHMNLDQRAKTFGISGFDTALPQDFVDNFIRLTGYNPVGDLVWLYRAPNRVTSFTFGIPFATTAAGQVALLQYLNQGGKA